MTSATAGAGTFITASSPHYRRVVLSMVAAGFSTFAIMNAVQPLMPLFSAEFGISAATASLSLSVTIAALALAMLVSAGLSDRFGRKPVMVASLWLSSLSLGATAFAPDWHSLLLLRALSGLAIAGVPAVAITYISEEVAPEARTRANGIYVSGAAFGGMAGRLLAASVAEHFGWHWALLSVAGVGVLTALAFSLLLPSARHFAPEGRSIAAQVKAFGRHLGDPVQRRLSLMGFVLMGTLVAIYNFLTYRLVAPPFGLSTALVGMLFLLYATGMASATLSGAAAARLGAARAARLFVGLAGAGVLLTLVPALWAILAGLTAFTVGFFAAHALASGATTRLAPVDKAQAATLYLLAYYLGGALFGWLFGLVWDGIGWPGVAIGIAALLALVLVLAPKRMA